MRHRSENGRTQKNNFKEIFCVLLDHGKYYLRFDKRRNTKISSFFLVKEIAICFPDSHNHVQSRGSNLRKLSSRRKEIKRLLDKCNRLPLKTKMSCNTW